MSRSIHVTRNNFKQLTKKEINAQAGDPQSDLEQWGMKSAIKKQVRKKRR